MAKPTDEELEEIKKRHQEGVEFLKYLRRTYGGRITLDKLILKREGG